MSLREERAEVLSRLDLLDITAVARTAHYVARVTKSAQCDRISYESHLLDPDCYVDYCRLRRRARFRIGDLILWWFPIRSVGSLSQLYLVHIFL